MRSKVSKTEVIIGFLAVLSIFLVVLGNIMLNRGRIPVGVYAVDLIICGVFVWDYVKRARESRSRSKFLKTNWYEPLAMIPAVVFDLMAGLPVLSAGLRMLRLVRFIRIVLVAARLRRTFAVADRFAERSNLLYLVVITAGIVLAAAFSVLAIEFRYEASPIKGIADALWWSLATVTTVGYGDIVPATPLGRMIGMLLMVVGIGVMATLISQVSAALVESRMKNAALARRSAEKDVDTLTRQVRKLPLLSDSELGALLRDIVEMHHRYHTTAEDTEVA